MACPPGYPGLRQTQDCGPEDQVMHGYFEWGSTKQSVLTLIGSTLGISGTILAVLIFGKKYYYLSRTYSQSIARKLSQKNNNVKLSESSAVYVANPIARTGGNGNGTVIVVNTGHDTP
jgi:hypothetical protein